MESRWEPRWREINEAIHQRDMDAVARLVRQYLAANRSSVESIYEASEFFRKVSNYSSALRVLSKALPLGQSKKPSEIETKLELQQARILNILGASRYALSMVDRIRKEKRDRSKIEMVEIYHCNAKYADVVALIGEDYPLPSSEPWHQDWLLHFYLAFAQNGLKQREPALRRVEKIEAVSQSPLIRAIARTYRGQFLVEAEQPKKALPVLLEAKKQFRGNDRTADHAIAQKWLGICYLKLGKPAEAERALRLAMDLFYQPALRAEDWMEIVLWVDRIPGRGTQQLFAPRLAVMGGPGATALSEVGESGTLRDGELLSISKVENKPGARHIDRHTDTAWEQGKARIGLDLVDRLLWNLIYAGKYGLPQYCVYELLWPEEPFSFDQHQKRLERVVGRARERGYDVHWEDLHLRLQSADVTASGPSPNVVRGGSFLNQCSEFTREDVQKFFSLSRTIAAELCSEWVQLGHAQSLSRGCYRSSFS